MLQSIRINLSGFSDPFCYMWSITLSIASWPSRAYSKLLIKPFLQFLSRILIASMLKSISSTISISGTVCSVLCWFITLACNNFCIFDSLVNLSSTLKVLFLFITIPLDLGFFNFMSSRLIIPLIILDGI